MISKGLFVVFASLFVVMIGFGITAPVLPFWVERLALRGGASPRAVVMHIGLLTGMYPLAQLFFAPVWGRWSDRIGRRPLFLAGIGGSIIAQVLFGVATSLGLLYTARILGGILSSATLPISAAYVSDKTSEKERGWAMAWLGTAISLGFVVGPALGGVLARRELHLRMRYGHFMIDSFSTPFFVAAALGLLTLFGAMRWLPESLPEPTLRPVRPSALRRPLLRSLLPLLALSVAGQFALAMFEAMFPLYAQARLNYGPAQVGTVFMICGLVMAVFQPGTVTLFRGVISEISLVGAGLGLIALSLLAMMMVRNSLFVFALTGLFALGMAVVSPNLAVLISNRGGRDRAGAALGLQNAANSLGQASAPLLGSALFAWQMNAPYLLTALLLAIVALRIGLKNLS